MLFSPVKHSMRSLRLLLLQAALTFLCAAPSLAQYLNLPPNHSQAHNLYGPDPEREPVGPLVAPLFLQTDQIDSAVTVINGLLQASPGTLTIRDLDGRVAAVKQITYAPHSSTVVDLRQVLAEAGSVIHAGSVVLQQDPSPAPPCSPSSRLPCTPAASLPF